MASTDFDIITIGGSLAGASLAKVIEEHGHEADALRARVFRLWELDSTCRLDTFASGPEHLIDEAVRQRFFGEDQ